MRRAKHAIVGLTLGLMLASAPAWAASDFEDIAVIFETLNQVLENQPTGVSVPWNNPETGNSGTITAVATEIQPDGTPCREYHRTYPGDTASQLVAGKACRTGNGVWSVVEESEVEIAPPWVEPEPEPQWREPEAEPDPVPERGPATAETQRELAGAGYYDGPLDGEMSPALREAILAYQTERDPAFRGDALAARLSED